MAEQLANDPMFVYAVAPLFIFWLGCCIGSFLNVCIWRIPRGESISYPPSHCPICDDAIPFYLNIPIVSWCVLKGRCRACKAPIAPRYVIVEFITGVLFLVVWCLVVRIGVLFQFLPGWLTFVSVLFCCSVIDWEQQIIPNKLTRFGVVTGLLFSGLFPIVHGAGIEGVLFPLQGEFFLPLLKSWLAKYDLFIAQNTWIEGVVASFMGVVVGYLLIAVFIEFGKLLMGRQKCMTDDAVEFKFCEEKLVFGEEEVRLGDVLSRKSDRVVVNLSESSAGAVQLLISDSEILVDGTKVGAGEMPTGMKTKQWVIPREVMGYGDAKLLAVCGAYLGPEGALLTLSLGSILACSMVLPYVLLNRTKKIGYIPFGGYISAGAFLLLVATSCF